MPEFHGACTMAARQQDAEYISFPQFKQWSLDIPTHTAKVPSFVDPFGNTDILPDRFEDPR